ncbi:MAG: hypothetical protein Q8R44_05805, partial [Novosphingobium sp.]|nr:hypothetical protein [Novosphingobium sp.]
IFGFADTSFPEDHKSSAGRFIWLGMLVVPQKTRALTKTDPPSLMESDPVVAAGFAAAGGA